MSSELPLIVGKTDKMQRRSNFSMKYIIIIAVGGLFIYGIYLYNSVQTRARTFEEKAEKYRQQYDSASAQLQVVYEHKTRLDKALQEEKKNHKQTKEEFTNRLSEKDSRHGNEKQELLRRVDSINQEKNILKSQNDDLQAEITKLNDQLANEKDDHQKRSQQHSEEYNRYKVEKENEIQKLKDEIANIKRQNEELQGKVNNAGSSNKNYQRQLEWDSNVIQKLQATINQLKNQQAQNIQGQNVQGNRQNLQGQGPNVQSQFQQGNMAGNVAGNLNQAGVGQQVLQPQGQQGGFGGVQQGYQQGLPGQQVPVGQQAGLNPQPVIQQRSAGGLQQQQQHLPDQEHQENVQQAQKEDGVKMQIEPAGEHHDAEKAGVEDPVQRQQIEPALPDQPENEKGQENQDKGEERQKRNIDDNGFKADDFPNRNHIPQMIDHGGLAQHNPLDTNLKNSAILKAIQEEEQRNADKNQIRAPNLMENDSKNNKGPLGNDVVREHDNQIPLPGGIGNLDGKNEEQIQMPDGKDEEDNDGAGNDDNADEDGDDEEEADKRHGGL